MDYIVAMILLLACVLVTFTLRWWVRKLEAERDALPKPVGLKRPVVRQRNRRRFTIDRDGNRTWLN